MRHGGSGDAMGCDTTTARGGALQSGAVARGGGVGAAPTRMPTAGCAGAAGAGRDGCGRRGRCGWPRAARLPRGSSARMPGTAGRGLPGGARRGGGGRHLLLDLARRRRALVLCMGRRRRQPGRQCQRQCCDERPCSHGVLRFRTGHPARSGLPPNNAGAGPELTQTYFRRSAHFWSWAVLVGLAFCRHLLYFCSACVPAPPELPPPEDPPVAPPSAPLRLPSLLVRSVIGFELVGAVMVCGWPTFENSIENDSVPSVRPFSCFCWFAGILNVLSAASRRRTWSSLPT